MTCRAGRFKPGVTPLQQLGSSAVVQLILYRLWIVPSGTTEVFSSNPGN